MENIQDIEKKIVRETYNVIIAFQTIRIFEIGHGEREFREVIANFVNYDDALQFWLQKCRGMENMEHEYWEENAVETLKCFWAFPTPGYQIYVGIEVQK